MGKIRDLLFLPSTLAGQSVLGSSGLGMKLEPLDAIQRALGGVGVTTRTATVLPGNPVAALDVLAPTIAFTVQPHWGKYTIGSERGKVQAPNVCTCRKWGLLCLAVHERFFHGPTRDGTCGVGYASRFWSYLSMHQLPTTHKIAQPWLRISTTTARGGQHAPA